MYMAETSETDEPEAEVFKYENPETSHKKAIERLCQTGSFYADVQIVNEGGANNMHSHTGNDGFWYVLGGSARFYGEGDEAIAELEENEGVLIPHDLPYWFESADGEELEILHIASLVEGVEDQRIDHETHWRKDDE